jgi:hypothetical protein
MGNRIALAHISQVSARPALSSGRADRFELHPPHRDFGRRRLGHTEAALVAAGLRQCAVQPDDDGVDARVTADETGEHVVLLGWGVRQSNPSTYDCGQRRQNTACREMTTSA